MSFDDLIRSGRDTDAMRYLAKEYYDNGKMGHTRKLLPERVADKLDAATNERVEGGDGMNENREILNEIYGYLQKTVWHMTVRERCGLQKLLKKVIQRDNNSRFLTEVDRENFKHHVEQFEADIFLIESKTKERVLTQTATIQMAINKISDLLDEKED